MGKIYCSECGTELDDAVNFCSNCGTPLDDDVSMKSVGKSGVSNDLSTKAKKSNKTNYSSSSKILLGIAGFFLVIVILGIVVIGSAMINSSDDTIDESSSETLSPSFTDSIYGINFQIPEGYETFDGTDNKNMGTSTTYDRSYLGPDANIIQISVSTTIGNFYWDLSQSRSYDDVDKTINGHDGILDAGGGFKYVTGDKLVIITGASEQQLESMIIE